MVIWSLKKVGKSFFKNTGTNMVMKFFLSGDQKWVNNSTSCSENSVPVWKIPFPISVTCFWIFVSNEHQVPKEVFWSEEQKWGKKSISCLQIPLPVCKFYLLFEKLVLESFDQMHKKFFDPWSWNGWNSSISCL